MIFGRHFFRKASELGIKHDRYIYITTNKGIHEYKSYYTVGLIFFGFTITLTFPFGRLEQGLTIIRFGFSIL